jgi:hypothetical protein
MILIDQALKPALSLGQSIWSNACVWHNALSNSGVYYSNKQRASVEGLKLTAQEAVENFIFDGKTINEIDAYQWPYNT